MSAPLKRVPLLLGIAWAGPVTLLSLLFVIIPLVLLGRIRYLGWRQGTWVWLVNHGPHDRIARLWRGGGQALGNIVILETDPVLSARGGRSFVHELEHVRQCMAFGPLFPLAYGFFYLILRFAVPKLNGYYDNPFEVAARRAAGQYVDVWGMVQKLRAAHTPPAP